MKRLFALLLVVAIVLSLPIISFATYTLPVGTYTVPQGIPAGDYYVKKHSYSSTLKLVRNGETLVSSELEYTPLPISIKDGDQITIESSEAFFYNDDMFKDYAYIEDGKYYCPEDIPSGKYTFCSLGGLWAGIALLDPSVVNEEGEETAIDFSLMSAGDTYTISIKEGQYFQISDQGYIKKHFKLFG